MENKLDGNAAAGTLQAIFPFEMKLVRATCMGCGTTNVIGATATYIHGMGTVIRCPSCDTALIIEDVGYNDDDTPLFLSIEHLVREASTFHVIRYVDNIVPCPSGKHRLVISRVAELADLTREPWLAQLLRRTPKPVSRSTLPCSPAAASVTRPMPVSGSGVKRSRCHSS